MTATASGSGVVLALLRRFSLSWRFVLLLVLFTAFAAGMVLAFSTELHRLEEHTVQSAQTLMLDGERLKLAVASNAMAEAIAAAIKTETSAEKRLETIRAMVDTFRFEDDKSGYFFVYKDTVNVALPPNKANQGKDLGDLKDKNNVYFVRELHQKAKAGGGFIEYIFPKPGQGDQPKLAYAAMIPGTDLWIGTGIYIDNVDRAKAAIRADNEARINSALTTIVGSVAVGLVVLIGVCAVIMVSVTRPIRQTTEAAMLCAAGDLSVRLDAVGNDEAARMQAALNTMVATLRTNMDDITAKTAEAEDKAQAAVAATRLAEEATQKAERAKAEGLIQAADRLGGVVAVVGTASAELSDRIAESSQGAEDQSRRMTETATAMEEMNATVLEVAKNASNAAGTTDAAKAKAVEGAEVVTQVVTAIGMVQEQATGLKADMDTLGRQAQDIGAVMNVISDIADQTNLLALNAAIEAARAGDAGRGFAVVADEVRKLAEKTMTATKEVGDAIRGIQAGASRNVGNVDAAAGAVTRANALAAQAGEALAQIVGLVENASDQVRSIATAAEEQSATSDEINRAVDAVSAISESNARAMAEASRTVAELARQSQELAALMEELEAEGRGGSKPKALV
ncbi:methyl-accepting chemotaxis protein [Desulfovibrio sp. TomC]|uniref:methyl-accepting chemotaxis protein n=1 Tax=Desulfovibrio sp. TomC TaxID=1562888 RepID=UPI000573EAD5|nr:methyl-accepting chemotaxis protein [Desulfovibrio sp. TomC]KHK03785.1 Methyl-accepting chemotaxis protein [Desulfovibrio sp. TomC]